MTPSANRKREKEVKRMAEKADRPKGPNYEEKGWVTDLVGGVLGGGAAGATNAWVQGKLGQGKNPPSPPKGGK
jgi:hypothetical protein